MRRKWTFDIPYANEREARQNVFLSDRESNSSVGSEFQIRGDGFGVED